MNNLPAVEFASKDVNQIVTDMISTYESLLGNKLAPGDPRRLFLLAVAMRLAHQRTLIDYSAKQNLLAYAEGDYLDHKGADSETERLSAKPALVTVKFTLSAPQPQDVTIPSGTRVSPGGQLFYAVVEDTVVTAGTTQIDITTECTTAGVVGNDWEPGQIKKLVDPLPWVQKVENTTTSSGGTDIEADDAYRERIHQAPESFSTAGPDEGYVYWAKTANQIIIDISVSSPVAGQVEIRPLLEGGQIPGQEILDAVEAKVNDKKVRPLTDQVTVLAPVIVNYDIVFTYYISTTDSAAAAGIQQAVDSAVTEYRAWQRARLGRDINPSKLISLVMAAGAKRLAVTSPVYTQITLAQVAHAQNVTVTYGGLEDD